MHHFSPHFLMFMVCFESSDLAHAHLDPILLHTVYTSIFRLRDGSTLTSVDSTSIDAMKGSVQRILAADGDMDWLNLTRSLPDDRLLGLLLLAVAGNFTVDQSPSALPQKCGIVVDPGTGALMLRDNAVAQSVILEVLLIVSIVCLLSAWGSKDANSSNSITTNTNTANTTNTTNTTNTGK